MPFQPSHAVVQLQPSKTAPRAFSRVTGWIKPPMQARFPHSAKQDLAVAMVQPPQLAMEPHCQCHWSKQNNVILTH